jgi:hypothetical protein
LADADGAPSLRSVSAAAREARHQVKILFLRDAVAAGGGRRVNLYRVPAGEN